MSESTARTPVPSLPPGVVVVSETAGSRALRFLPEGIVPPGLVAGITTSAFGDLRLDAGPDGPLRRWEELRVELARQAGVRGVALSRQVHGAAIRTHRIPVEGVLLAPDADGHLVLCPGMALAVTLADCVPVFLLPADGRSAGLLHAGWRGTAAGILEQGLQALGGRTGVTPEEVHVHLGPSIGGPSYEVSPDVLQAVLPGPGPGPHGSAAAHSPTPSEAPVLLDLRAALAVRALAAGVPAHQVTLSSSDTLNDPGLFSHRGGDAGRHVAFVALRDAAH